MVADYLLAPALRLVFEAYAERPHGSLLLSGPPESDLRGAAGYLLGLIYGPAESWPGQVYQLEQKGIGAVRELLGQLALTRFDAAKPRLILIFDCDGLSLPAQNALLKGLEEPPAGSHFLLTSSKVWRVLPTIVSRCQQIVMRPPLKQAVFDTWSELPTDQLERAYWATDGWPRLMHDYLEEPESDLRQQIEAAKAFLAFGAEERLRYLFGRATPDGKVELALFLETLLAGLWRTTRAALLAAAYRGEDGKADLWRRKFLTVNQLREDFESGLNHKIILLNLALRF